MDRTVSDVLDEMRDTVEIIEHQLEIILKLIKLLNSQEKKDDRRE